jgi:hypothetical protein
VRNLAPSETAQALIGLMPALGYSRPKWAVRAMSGLPPFATELRTPRHVANVPITEVANFIQLLGLQERGVRVAR